jgi:hypothetical protein
MHAPHVKRITPTCPLPPLFCLAMYIITEKDAKGAQAVMFFNLNFCLLFSYMY